MRKMTSGSLAASISIGENRGQRLTYIRAFETYFLEEVWRHKTGRRLLDFEISGAACYLASIKQIFYRSTAEMLGDKDYYVIKMVEMR